MATVTGYTATRMAAIENQAIIGGVIDGSGHLILSRNNGGAVDAGAVISAAGTPFVGQYTTAGRPAAAGMTGKILWDITIGDFYKSNGTSWSALALSGGGGGDISSTSTTVAPIGNYWDFVRNDPLLNTQAGGSPTVLPTEYAVRKYVDDLPSIESSDPTNLPITTTNGITLVNTKYLVTTRDSEPITVKKQFTSGFWLSAGAQIGVGVLNDGVATPVGFRQFMVTDLNTANHIGFASHSGGVGVPERTSANTSAMTLGARPYVNVTTTKSGATQNLALFTILVPGTLTVADTSTFTNDVANMGLSVQTVGGIAKLIYTSKDGTNFYGCVFVSGTGSDHNCASGYTITAAIPASTNSGRIHFYNENASASNTDKPFRFSLFTAPSSAVATADGTTPGSAIERLRIASPGEVILSKGLQLGAGVMASDATPAIGAGILLDLLAGKGLIAIRPATWAPTPTTGTINDASLPTTSKVKIALTGNAIITGITAPTVDGAELRIINTTAFNLTLAVDSGANGNATSLAANRIVAFDNVDKVGTAACTFSLTYDLSAARWYVIGTAL